MRQYTVNEVAAIFQLNSETIRRMIREGRLNAVRNVGRSGNTIYEQDLVEFVERFPEYRIYWEAHAGIQPAVDDPVVDALMEALAELQAQREKLDCQMEILRTLIKQRG